MATLPANRITRHLAAAAGPASDRDDRRIYFDHRLAELGQEARHLTRVGVLVVLKLGEIIAEARGIVCTIGRDSEFSRWLNDHLPHVTLRTAERYVRIAMEFSGVETELLERFDVTALYQLARDDTPPQARDAAFALARAGNSVSAAQARRIVAEATGDNASPATLADHEPRPKPERIVTPSGIILVKPNDGVLDVVAALQQALAAHAQGDPQ